jgi:hypothetical protein
METRAVSRLPTRLFQCAVDPFFNHILYLINRKPDEKKIPPPPPRANFGFNQAQHWKIARYADAGARDLNQAAAKSQLTDDLT